MKKLTGLTAACAVLVTSLGIGAAPAEARGRHHGGGWHHYHHDDGIDAGDVIGGLFIIGAIAAIASAASKDKGDSDYRYRPPPPEQPGDAGDQDDRAPPPGFASAGDENEQRAIDACSWAAEADSGDGARVQSIAGTRPDQGHGWYVAGTVAKPGERARSFGCTYRSGRVADVNFG